MSVFSERDLSSLDGDVKALSTADLVRIAQAVRAQPGFSPGLERATKLLEGLVGKRQFDAAATLAESFVASGTHSSRIGKLFAQALIDSGQLARAATELEKLLSTMAPKDPELLEVQGLSGRLAKQRYMNGRVTGAADAEDLIKAIDCYLMAYDGNPAQPSWHGINAVALLERAKKDRVDHPALARSRTIAEEIFEGICKGWETGEVTFWDCATASEAALALRKPEAAELWLLRYVTHPDVPPFAVASTLRQYREVWLLSLRTQPGSTLLPLLENKLSSFGQMQMQVEEVRAGDFGGNYEKVFGKDAFVSHAKYLSGVERAKVVARVENKQGDPKGTGFLVKGADLGPGFAAYPLLLLTNAHVISETDADALHPDDACCTFYGVQVAPGVPAPKCTMGKILWTSPPSELDVAILSLNEPLEGVIACPIARAIPKPGPDSKVFVIGYPSGGGLAYSLYDCQLLEYEENGFRARYRTPTEPGSSGSPVFNQNWELIAIHHSGDWNMKMLSGVGTYDANEGILMRSIREALK